GRRQVHLGALLPLGVRERRAAGGRQVRDRGGGPGDGGARRARRRSRLSGLEPARRRLPARAAPGLRRRLPPLGGLRKHFLPAKRIIPCLDVDGGRVVKGVRFVELRDAGDPAELAATYDAAGADELVCLDITASSEERDILFDAVSRTADQVFIPLTVGGGVRSTDDMQQ